MPRSVIALLPVLLSGLLVAWLGAAACGDRSRDSDRQPPDYEGGDGDLPSHPDGDGDNRPLPRCTALCTSFCDWVSRCPDNGLSAEERINCLSLCNAELEARRIPSRLACTDKAHCAAFVECLSRSANPVDCRLDDSPDPPEDGDGSSTDGDDTDVEPPTGPPCTESARCPPETLCDPLRGQCLPSCNPSYASCENGWVCRLITEGEHAGRGKGVCDAPWQGNTAGQSCASHGDCAPRLLCGRAGRCEAICVPGGFENCPEGVACVENASLGVASCAWCRTSTDCPAGRLCHDGRCLEDVECRHSRECDGELACVHGRCTRALCRTNADCEVGTCDPQGGFCHANQCENDCSREGLCCWRHSCGPCCPTDCPAPFVCAPDASCYPSLRCCTEQPDCRMMPRGFCGGERCSATSGACGGACLETCQWGYECGRHTAYRCRPSSPVSCEYVGMTCRNDSCMECNGERLGDPGWCVATESCGLSALPEGFTCDPDPLFSLECARGLACCRRPEGGHTCCPPARCHPGYGCLEENPEEEPPPYTCPGCDSLLGEWVRDNQDCPAPWDRLFVSRNPNYGCELDIRHSTDDWQHHLTSLRHCERQVVQDVVQTPYEGCILFWDADAHRFAFHCEAAHASCRTLFIPSGTR